MAAIGQYVATVKNGTLAQATVANAGRDGTGTLATILTAGATGSRIDAIAFNAPGATTAGMLRLFITVGATTRFIGLEIPVQPVTPSISQPAWAVNFIPPTPIVLEAGASLRFTTHNAETFNAIPTYAGDF